MTKLAEHLIFLAAIAFCGWIAWHAELEPLTTRAVNALTNIADTLDREQRQ